MSDDLDGEIDRCVCGDVDEKCMYCRRREAGVPDPGVFF